MKSERVYEWGAEVGGGDIPSCIKATVSGRYIPERGPAYDHGGLPAEYPDVNIEAWSAEHNCDITDSLTDEDIDRFTERALELDWEAMADGFDYDPREGDE